MPSISIIVPVYQVEPYLRRCVDSILEQTFSDFELLLVDDGSPDNCPAICDEYAAKDHRVRVIHQTNGGLSVARNTGIAHATGMYLCFIDSDDILSHHYCERLYRAAVEKDCQIASCRMERFKGETVPTEGTQKDGDSVEIMPYMLFLRKEMSGDIEIGVCSKLFHRSLFETVQFMTGKLHEDILFAGDLLSIGGCQVAYIDAPLYYYRQRDSSIMQSQVNSVKCSPDRIFAGHYLLECAKRVGYPYVDVCLDYVIRYPWFFVDPIYVRFSFRDNRAFMDALQKLIREHKTEYRTLLSLNSIQRHRILLFAHSRILYGINAYARLIRVYFYRILGKDAYSDGHGI